MTISVRQLTGAVVVSFCVGAFMTPVGTQVQGAAKPAPAPPPAAEASHLHAGGVHEGARG